MSITVNSQNEITYYKMGWDTGSCATTVEVNNASGIAQIQRGGPAGEQQ